MQLAATTEQLEAANAAAEAERSASQPYLTSHPISEPPTLSDGINLLDRCLSSFHALLCHLCTFLGSSWICFIAQLRITTLHVHCVLYLRAAQTGSQ